MKSWLEFRARFEDKPEDWSPVVAVFEAYGCPSSQIFDSPASATAYLVEGPASESIAPELIAALRGAGATDVEVASVPDEDWSDLRKLHFKPIRIGTRFVVRPTWEAFDLNPGDIELVLDPGQAFGTGDHPTTRMCLELLERHIDSNVDSVLDLGTGSGILAIAAKKLGVAQVTASDIDPVSIEVCLSNCRQNLVDLHAFEATGFDDQRLAGSWPMIVSNIISATLIRIAPEAARRVEPNGKWIVSGIIEANWGDVRAASERAGFTLFELVRQGEWVAAVFHRAVG